LIALVQKLLADERMRQFEPTTEQMAMVKSIGESLDVTPGRGRRRVPVAKTTRKPAVKRRKSA
jgi:hypothetical protein